MLRSFKLIIFIILVLIFLVLLLASCSSGIDVQAYISMLLVIVLPFIWKIYKKQDLKSNYPFGFIMLILVVILFIQFGPKRSQNFVATGPNIDSSKEIDTNKITYTYKIMPKGSSRRPWPAIKLSRKATILELKTICDEFSPNNYNIRFFLPYPNKEKELMWGGGCLDRLGVIEPFLQHPDLNETQVLINKYQILKTKSNLETLHEFYCDETDRIIAINKNEAAIYEFKPYSSLALSDMAKRSKANIDTPFDEIFDSDADISLLGAFKKLSKDKYRLIIPDMSWNETFILNTKKQGLYIQQIRDTPNHGDDEVCIPLEASTSYN